MTTTEPTDDETEANSYTVHHISEAAAERAVDRFNRKADRVKAGDDGAVLSGSLHIHDCLLDELDDVVFLVDGEPLGEYLAGRVGTMKILAGEK